MRPKNWFLFCLRLETRSNIYYFWSFTMHSLSSSNFLLRPWRISTIFYSMRARYSVRLSDSSVEDLLKRSNFFIDETKKVVLTCLRLETRSNIYNILSFTMHSLSSSNFFFGPGSLVLRFTLREQDILFISVIHPWGIVWKEASFHRCDRKRGFNLSTLRNTFQHSLLLKYHHALSIFIKLLLRPWRTSTPFYSKRARYSVRLSDSTMEDILKRSSFYTNETKKWF